MNETNSTSGILSGILSGRISRRTKTADGCRPGFRLSPTAIYTSGTLGLSGLTSASRPISGVSATCVSMIPIPVKEEQEFIDAIIRDIHWLGFDWENRLFYASSYFEQMYQYALKLIEAGKAYVDDSTAGQIHEYRGTLTEPGKVSPYRDRPAAENLDLFNACEQGNSQTAHGFYGRRLTWPPPT